MSSEKLSEKIEKLRGERDHLSVKLNLAEQNTPRDHESIGRLERSLVELEGIIAAKTIESKRLRVGSHRRS